MLDQLERLETAAERQYDEMRVDEETFWCGCGRVELWAHMLFVDPSPYAAPVCRFCLDEYCKEHGYDK